MIKHILFTAALVIASAMAGEAMAAPPPPCPSSGYTLQNTGSGLAGLFNNNSICATATTGGEKWHEYHNPILGGGSGSAVFEKNGDGTAVDPNVGIGNWSILQIGSSGNYYIEYTYSGGGGIYDYDVYANGSSVELCKRGGYTQIATGTLAAGRSTTPCP